VAAARPAATATAPEYETAANRPRACRRVLSLLLRAAHLPSERVGPTLAVVERIS